MKRVGKEFCENESGAVAVYAAVGMAVCLACAALALDIAHLVSVRRELAKAAEAGALSGARNLWPHDLTTAAGRLPNCANAETWARTTAAKNRVDGANLTTGEVSVEVGQWDYALNQFTPGHSANANAVRVTTARANIQMIFAPIFGVHSKNMTGAAIAVMDFAKGLGPGTPPIALNKDYANTDQVVYIGFNPDPEDNGGWFAKAPDSANDSTFKDYLNGGCPPLEVGDTINLQNGSDASVLHLMKDILDAHPDGWKVSLPVVDTSKFNHEDQISSFVPFLITKVKDTGDPKYVKGIVLPLGMAGSGMPGGGNQGALAPPKLVN